MYMLESPCNDATFAAVLLFIKNLIEIVGIVAPVLLILVLTIDFVRAIITGDGERAQKVKSRVLTRIIFCIALIFTPTIIESVMGFIGDKNVSFADCYSKVTNSYVDELTAKLEAETKEKEKARQNTINDIKQKRAQSEKQRQKNADKARKDYEKKVKEEGKTKSDNMSDYSMTQKQKKKKYNTTSTSENVRKAKTYSSYHQLGTISSCDLSVGITGGTVQGVAVTNNYYIISSNSGVVIVYDKQTHKRLKVYSKNTGHGNGISYNPNSDVVMIAKSYAYLRTYRYVYFFADQLGTRSSLNANEKSFPQRASAVAYDRVLNQYYLGGGDYLWIWAGPTKKNKRIQFYKTLRSGIMQDIGAHNGVIYVCRVSGGNYIDLYKASTKKYIGSYKVTVSGELEGIDYDPSTDRFVLAFHGPGKVCQLKANAITMK